MVTVRYDLDVYQGYAAAKSDTDIWIYDENWRVIHHISGIYGSEWDWISIQNGEWMDPSDVPSYEDILEQRVSQLEAELAAERSNEHSTQKLVGEISGRSVLSGVISVPFDQETPELVGYLSIPKQYGERYDGSYEVIPTSGFQILDTEEKFLEEDIIVHPISYAEVSNNSGGYTATIGG